MKKISQLEQLKYQKKIFISFFIYIFFYFFSLILFFVTDSSELQSKTDRICEIMRDGIKKCMKDKHYNHIEEIFGSEHIKRGKINPRRLFISLDDYINLRDSEKELLRQQLDYNGISIQDLINFIGLDYDVSVMMEENSVLRDTHKITTNSLYIYNRYKYINIYKNIC